MPRRRYRLAAGSAIVLAVMALGMVRWLDRPEGSASTDRRAQVVTEAAGYERPSSAADVLEAIEAGAVRHGGVTVVQARDLPARLLSDPRAELIYHLHEPNEPGDWSLIRHARPVDACYRATFTHYRGTVERIDCPADLTPVVSAPVRAPDPPSAQLIPEYGRCYSGSGDCPGG